MSKPIRLALLLCAGLACAPAYAQEQKPAAAPDPAAALDALLQKVRENRGRETRENAEREARFIAARAEQQKLLAQAKGVLAATEKRSDELKAQYDVNEKKLAELESLLNERMGALGEMFGVVRLVAGDTNGLFAASLVSAQIPGRSEFLSRLSSSKKLPETPELEQLWVELLQEMVQSGKVARFTAKVVKPDGSQSDQTVVRVGVFNAVSGGQFLVYDNRAEQLKVLVRQPASRYQSLAADLEKATSGTVPMAVDPSRGAILSLIVEAPSFLERIQQGGWVGYIIIALGAMGLAVVVLRFLYLQGVGRKIHAQLKRAEPDKGNPLGRIMSAYRDDLALDVETLGLKLDEAILKEVPALERGLSAIKIVAAVAPLLGLLGTVTGMIVTFQAITLLGTGDPKLMAGGISMALVTTVQGLCVAIPLVLLHGWLAGKSADLVQILDEQSAGMVAEHAERKRAARPA